MRRNKALILQVSICSEMENVDNDPKKLIRFLLSKNAVQRMCKTTLTKKVAHQIRKTYFRFSKLTPDSQNSLRIWKTNTKFVKVRPNLGSS